MICAKPAFSKPASPTPLILSLSKDGRPRATPAGGFDKLSLSGWKGW